MFKTKIKKPIFDQSILISLPKRIKFITASKLTTISTNLTLSISRKDSAHRHLPTRETNHFYQTKMT